MLSSRILRYSGLGLCLAVLAAGPFFRGLFFWTELLAAITVIAVGFCLWLVGRRLGGLPAGVPGGVAGAALLALLGCYVLQFAWAVFPRGNMDWVLRVAAAWFVYMMMRAEAGPALRRWLAWAFVLSASSVAVVGFMEYTGYFLNDPAMAQSLAMVGLNERMFTVLQYPNTAAVYFLAAIFAACGLGLAELRAWQMAAAGALVSLLSLACFFTVSRGAVVVFPFGLLVLFVGLDREKRWPALLLLLGAWAPVVVAMNRVGVFSAAHNYVSAFRWVAAAVVGGALAGLAVAYFVRLRGRVQALVVGAAVVAGVAGLLVLRPAGAGLLPKQATRMLDINFNTVNVVLRLIYDKDAARMVADAPFGRGGWGWERSYRQYQTFNWTARDTHDQFAQTAVEAGVPGLIALLVGLGAALWAAWRNRGGDSLSWSLAAAAALVAGHSLIDFNLSYGLVWLLLWSLLGAAACPTPALQWQRTGPGIALTLGAGATALAGLLFGGARYTDQAAVLASQSKPDGAAVSAAARQATRYDRWDSQPLLLIGGVPALERGARLDPRSAKIHWDLTILLERKQDLRGALSQAKLALAAQPMLSMHYSKVASLAGSLMVDALHRGDKAEAKPLADELVALGADLNRRKTVAAPDQRLWGGTLLEMAPDFKLRYGQALYLTGKPQEAESYLVDASKTGLLGSEAEVWLYAMYERRGDKQAMALLENKPWVRFRSANPVYKLLKTW